LARQEQDSKCALRFLSGGYVALSDALEIVSLSDPGMVRDNNEDSVASLPEAGLVVLADGMGGYNAGEVASAMATSTITAGIAQAWTADALKGLDRDAAKALSQTVLQEQAKKANLAIYNAAQNDAQCADMGTTLVTCLFYDNFVTVAHMGDSRLYRLRDDVLEKITRDHSWLQEQIDTGMISAEEAHLSNNKNLLTRAVGIYPDDEAEIHTYDVVEDDIFLLCSDGLFAMIDHEELQMSLTTLKANLDLAAQMLIQAANDAGGSDNVSVILVRIAKNFAAGSGT
jgi:serine/threonine protein phosphatase PrpC